MSVDLSPRTMTLTQGQNQRVVATVRDKNGAALSGLLVTWGSDTSSTASVDTTGLVVAAASGSANVTATVVGTSVQNTAAVTVNAQATGGIKHIRFGRTNFGVQPPDSDMTWGWGPPLNRFMFAMSGSSTAVHAINPNSIAVPYCLHHFCVATGQEALEGNNNSWGTLAQDWATANGKNVESIFLHAAIGQNTNSAVVASVSTGGLVTLGVNPSNNKQMQAQGRAGVPASDAFIPGQSYTLTTTSPAQTVTVTAQSVPSLTTIQTTYSGLAATGGSIFHAGDGTLTFANRIFFESETDWAWATNFQNADARAFQVYRVGQIVADGSNGCFFDTHNAGSMHWPSLEYGTTGGSTAYVNDVCTCFGLYRSTYPGTLYFPNLSNFVTAQDAQMADAAGGCQQEGGINLFSVNPFSTGNTVDFTIARLAAGTLCEVSTHPDFNTAEPHAGIQGAPTLYNSSGGNHCTTAADRAIMAEYAAMLMMVNQGQPKRLYFDPANDNWTTFPITARWETGFETALGEPVNSLTPPKFIYSSGTDISGKAAHVYARLFSVDGTQSTRLTALVLFRRYDGNTAAYNATTAFATTVVYAPPAGTTWGVMNDQGTVTGSLNLGDPIPNGLWNPDAVFLVPVATGTTAAWFASPTGSSANSGTQASPWDLTTALNGGSAAQVSPGDTIWLRAGTYGTGAETINASVSGSGAAPVVVKPFPGEHVILDLAQLNITGSNVWYINDSLTGPGNFEITRSTTTPDGTDLVRMQDAGDGLKLQHLAVHDAGGVGISPQSETADHEVYGCYIANNGRSPSLAPVYGEGIYPHGTTTAGTTRKIRANIIIDNVGYGLHAFADTGNGQNWEITDNICFGNALGNGDDFHIGGFTVVSGLICERNVALSLDQSIVGEVGYLQPGFVTPPGTSATVTNNYFMGTLNLMGWDGAALTFQNNEIVDTTDQAIRLLFHGAVNVSGFAWNNNTYVTTASAGFGTFSRTITTDTTASEATFSTLAAWQAALGIDSGSTLTVAANDGTKTFLTPSLYVTGRGHLAIHNPTSAATVAVDLSSVVTSGHPYAIYDAYDLWGTPILTGTYTSGTVAVPMTGTGKTPPAVVGGGFTATNAHPQVGAYVVLQTA